MPRSFQLLLGLTTVLLAMVLAPVASALLVAAVLAAVLWPVQRWLSRRAGRRLAAGLLTFGLIGVLLGPLATAVVIVVRDGDEGLRFMVEAARSERVTNLVAQLPGALRSLVSDGIARMPSDLDGALGGVLPLGEAMTVTSSFMLQTALMLIALFFLLLRGDQVVAWIDGMSPLRPGQTHELLHTFRNVSYAVVVAEVITAAVQALAALCGFYIAQVPNPIFFAIVTFFVAFIPAVGAAAVTLVAAFLMLVTGHPYLAAFLVVWGLAVVGLIDNVLRPLLVRRGMESHGAPVFFALVGGLAAFGAIGLLVGPLALALFLALIRMYRRDFPPPGAQVHEMQQLEACATTPPHSTS